LRANATAPTDRQYKMAGFIANSDRMRNEDVPVERGPNDFRVLCLGDSITFGYGVRYQEAYPTVLERLLRHALPDRRVHVLNGACPAYTIHQGHEVLRRRGLKYQADVVTIWFGWNDSSQWDRLTDHEHASLFKRDSVLDLSAMHRLADYTLDRHRLKRLSRQRETDGQSVPRMPLDDYRKRLQDMTRMVRRTDPGGAGRRGRVVFILGCYNNQVVEAARRGGEFSRDAYQDALLDVAADLRVPVLHVARVLIEAGHGREVFMDKGHLDATGQRAVAIALRALLDGQGLLPCVSPSAGRAIGARPRIAD
jgi:lysophospholipase L1-like esterase